LLRNLFVALYIISVEDLDPGSGLFWPLDPGSGSEIRDGKNPDPGSGMNILDLNFEKLVTVFWVKKS
jgi:hypothetical protein